MRTAVLGGNIILGHEGDPQVLGLGRLENLLVAALGVQLQQEMKARILLADLHPARQRGLPQGQQELVPEGPVVVAHPVDVFFKISLREEPGQGHLLQAGDRAGIKPQGLIKPGDQVLGQNQIADPKGRGQALGKGIDIDKWPQDFIIDYVHVYQQK